MFNIHVIQSEEGDCFLLEFGEGVSRYILIDGGPGKIYETHLKEKLKDIRANDGKLDLVINSHVDTDHIIGLLDLLAENLYRKESDLTDVINIDQLWFNSFSNTIGEGTNIEAEINRIMVTSHSTRSAAVGDLAIQAIKDGNKFRILALQNRIPINTDLPKGLICVDDKPDPHQIDNLTIKIVGPTRDNLKELQSKWIDWLNNHPDETSWDTYFNAMADSSYKNLSSIMILVEAHEKKVLFTGDGRGDHLLDGLKKVGLLDQNGKMHVDVFKIPHHGSDQNITRGFLGKITADTYLISGNGKHDNPDYNTLKWIVQNAKKQNRNIKIFVTNKTENTEKILADYDKTEYKYELVTMKETTHTEVIKLGD